MYTDLVGYTALGQRNESLSLMLVDGQRKIIRPILKKHYGNEIKTMGDAFLVEFPSALDAVRCAYDIQRNVREYNISQPDDRRIQLRIGIHLGDVVSSQGDISGDAVNVASRIVGLAEDGGVCMTRQVYDQVQNKFELPLTSLGTKSLKNVSSAVEVFRMTMPWEQKTRHSGGLDQKRIAVLPFANMSPDPNDEYFADGITDEIISTVAGISNLSVISRTSVMGYKGTTKRVGEIGRELEVGSVLEGSFRKAGNKIRITAQLIDVASDRHLWAQTFDRQLDDVFAVQSDIAKNVAEALRVKILSPEMHRIRKKPTESSRAFTLYLKGRSFLNKRGLEDTRKAAKLFERAIKADPHFALGYVGLADCHELLSVNWGVERQANHLKASKMVTKALELDPELAEAHASKALVLSSDFDFRGAERQYRRAIELKPSYAPAHMWYGQLLRSEQRWSDSIEHLEKAVELDPLSLVINLNLAHYYDSRRDYRKALQVYKQAIALSPASPFGREALAFVYGRLKMFDEAKRELDMVVKSLKGCPILT